jgi:Bacterial regulatory proteins, tetR family
MSFETSESDGPDPYVVPGFSLHTELEWLVKSGFSPMQALQSATFNPAGVGAGTLYRHFPTRDALIEAVYRSEVEKLAAAEGRFAETLSPVEALRAWMIQAAIDALVKRAIKSGDIRRDLDPFDLLRALIGVSHVASGPGWQQSGD